MEISSDQHLIWVEIRRSALLFGLAHGPWGYRYVEGLGSFASLTFSLLFVVCVPLVLMNVFFIKTKNKKQILLYHFST